MKKFKLYDSENDCFVPLLYGFLRIFFTYTYVIEILCATIIPSPLLKHKNRKHETQLVYALHCTFYKQCTFEVYSTASFNQMALQNNFLNATYIYLKKNNFYPVSNFHDGYCTYVQLIFGIALKPCYDFWNKLFKFQTNV